MAPTIDIAVFGSSEPLPGQTRYESARALGDGLARAGFGVVTGGYGGVMEAASRGAREAGGTATGVVCGLFSERVYRGVLLVGGVILGAYGAAFLGRGLATER